MHTWWAETWEGSNPVTPPEVHQRSLQMLRQCRIELQKSSYALTPVNDGEPVNTDTQSQRDADYTNRQKQQAKEPAMSSSTQLASTLSWTLHSHNEPSHSSEDAQPPRRSKPMRNQTDEDTEAQADQAAKDIVELVEQETTSRTQMSVIFRSIYWPRVES